METEELKRKLMGLWEKTTHNSKDLLGILFDYYFDINYIEYKETEGKIVSAICGIPYTFGYGKNILTGLYLISLSSEEGFRKKGILAELLNNFNERVKNEFDFTFLVPHTELLADYFGTLGYFSSFFILEERFTPLHDFKNDYSLSFLDADDRIKELKEILMTQIQVSEFSENSKFNKSQIIKFIEKEESKVSGSISMNHTEKDLDYILNKDTVSHLNTFYSYDDEGKITGVAFTQKEDLKRIKVVAIYVTDTCSYFTLLDFIKHQFEDHSISVISPDPKYQYNSIVQLNYASANPEGGDLDNTFRSIDIPFNINRLLQPMGMVKLLRFNKILDFIANTRSDIDFKLHIRYYFPDGEDSKEGEKIIYTVKNGNFSKEITNSEISDRSILILSEKEVSELLLRKNDSSNLIMEAFGIPRLNLQMRLLPY